MKNAQDATVQVDRLIHTTFKLRAIDGIQVPFQHGIPVPSFDPQDRLKLDLAGVWRKQRFQADHDFSLSVRGEKWFTRLAAEAEGRFQEVYDDSAWETMTLPLPENRLGGKAEARSAETYEDGVWYRRTFRLNEDWAGLAVTLHALSISYVCDIWVNGQWAGYHEGGFTPFALDLTPYITLEGPNVIAIRVDNPPWGSREDIIPATPGTDFFNYTGIIHDLYLSGSSLRHISRVQAVPLNTDGQVRFVAVVENRSDAHCHVRLSGELWSADREAEAFLQSPYAADIKSVPAPYSGAMSAELELMPWETRVYETTVRVTDPKLWSFYEPNLYVAQWKLEDERGCTQDTFHTQFGIRTVTTEGTKLLLNGRPVFLAGIARHEEWPEFGRTATWERIREDLLQMKQHMKVNFVRTAHYPNHMYTSILLDRLGLATASEIPLWQFERKHYAVQEIKGLSDQMWREMIFSQYNRPSVLMWSTQNESVEVELRTAYNVRVVNDWKQNYYDGRLSTQSAAADQPGAHDPSMEPLDVAGWTMYFGIFHGSTYYEGTRDFMEKVQACWPGKPVWNTEYGHWSGDGDVLASQQVVTYEDTLRAMMEFAVMDEQGALKEDGFLVGIDFWIMYDWYVNHNNWIDTFGIYHMDRVTAKPIAEKIRSDYERFTSLDGGFIRD
jgi:beta-galactosidase